MGSEMCIRDRSWMVCRTCQRMATSPMGTMKGYRGHSTYSINILGGVEALGRALAVELAPIRVNVVCPGMTKTEMWDGLSSENRESMYREVAAKLPVGRVGEAMEVAESYLYLMRQTYCTGEVVVVDGGGVLV